MTDEFLIPTYGRADRQLTLRILLDMGAKDIRLQAQTKEDRDELFRRYAKNDAITVGYHHATRLSENANNALKAYEKGEFVCVMDDDLTSFTCCDVGTRRKATPRQFDKALEGLCRKMDREGSNIGVIYPLSNQSMAAAAKRARYEKNALSTGSAIIIRVGYCVFDESLTSCEDYDIQLREISDGRCTIRANSLAPNYLPRLRKNGQQQGGRGFFYEDKEHVENLREILRRYSPIVRLSKNGNSIRLDGRYV